MAQSQGGQAVSTSPRSDVIQWHDRSKIQLLEHIASLEKEVSIESQRATHYREEWQTSLMALKEQEKTIRSLCENLHRHESNAESLNQRIKRLEEAGDVLAQRAEQLGLLPMAIEGWNKAKEAKP
jgi:septal ring factor EnvC (AmiA/AmiB activator)